MRNGCKNGTIQSERKIKLWPTKPNPITPKIEASTPSVSIAKTN
jgi:hypothetical protein